MIPDKFEALHLYKASFSQPIKFPNLAPRTLSVLGDNYLVWGISGKNDYNIFIYVLSQKSSGTGQSAQAVMETQAAVGISVIIIGILAVLGLGLTIVLFKNVTEVFGAGGLGITFALIIGTGGFFLFKKL